MNDEDDMKITLNSKDIEMIDINKSIREEDEIVVSTIGLSEKKINQLIRLKKLIRMSNAYSIHYYNRALFWKILYFTTSFTSVVLSASTVVVNTFYNPCSNNPIIRNYNTILGSIITVFLGIISVLDARARQQSHEIAGDHYRNLGQLMYREVFVTDKSYTEIDLTNLMEKYDITFAAYTDSFTAPPIEKINKIMQSKEYDLSIKLLI
jgi:hypothetical protein